MRLFLLFVFSFISVSCIAQERCATAAYIAAKGVESTTEAKRMKEADAFLKKGPAAKSVAEEAVLRIPVVVHVLYNNASQNISQAQIRSGLLALNRDFRRQNADTSKTPSRFRHLAADIQIEFYLATADPQGRPTSGIERKATNRFAWLADDKVKHAWQGGMDAWDSRSYLNIWICNLSGGSGYSSVPGSAPENDGIVIQYNAFGTLNTAAPFNMGRTAVHEVGHWLGLKHIWGDAQCGDDGVNDTPQQGFFTQGCPTIFRSSCNNGSAGDMFMNYMDYTNDACMNLFTLGQRERMRSAFYEGGPRASLLKSKGLQEPWLHESSLPAQAVASLYPNPARENITIQADNSQIGKGVQFLTSQGQVIRTELITARQQSFSIQHLKPGVYFLKGDGFLHKFIKL